MPVPNEAYWGPNEEGQSLHYGELRAMEDRDRRIQMLRRRLEAIFIAQVEPLAERRAGFPLVVMTCIGIETLGQIFHSNEEGQSGPFLMACKNVHQRLSRRVSKKLGDGLAEMWKENKEIEKIEEIAELFYKYLRNELVHGYQARGIYLSYEDTPNMEIKEDEGYIILNPGWFWMSYKDCFNKYFYDLVSRKLDLKERALDYIDRLLK